MKVLIFGYLNPRMFTHLMDISRALSERGIYIKYISSYDNQFSTSNLNINHIKFVKAKSFFGNIPILKSYPFLIYFIYRFKPDIIIAGSKYIIPSYLYKKIFPWRSVELAGHFTDYTVEFWPTRVLGRFSNLLDAYIDICDIRVGWRQRDWPRMKAVSFVTRLAPLRRDGEAHVTHAGPARIVFTGSWGLLKDRERLAAFLDRLCAQGVSVDWYLPGPEDVRVAARSLSDHPLYSVRDPIPKSELIAMCSGYDAGLFWAPMADCDPSVAFDRSVYISAASNKIGEYIAAGLVVAHAGNPGLSYLPEAVTAAFDPTDPIAGADQLAALLSDRATVERKRRAALQYHLDEMNFEAQAQPFIDYVARSRDPGR